MIAMYVQLDPVMILVLFNRKQKTFLEARNLLTMASVVKVCTRLGWFHQEKWMVLL